MCSQQGKQDISKYDILYLIKNNFKTHSSKRRKGEGESCAYRMHMLTSRVHRVRAEAVERAGPRARNHSPQDRSNP